MLLHVEDYSEKQAEEVLRQTRAGYLPHEYCGKHPAAPYQAATVGVWAGAHKEFLSRLETARRDGADALVAHCVKIADEDTKADHKKIQIEARMKAAALWYPEKYGPKADKEPPSGIQGMVHMPYKDLPADKRAVVDKFFGTDDD
jgi:hypothetical protein